MRFKNKYLNFLTLILPLLCWALLLPKAFADTSQKPLNILLIHSYHNSFIWDQDIQSHFKSHLKTQRPVVYHVEYLDTKRIPFTPKYQQALTQYLKTKYSQLPPDLIMVSDNNAYDLMRHNGKKIFKNFAQTPVVFCGINDFNPAQIKNHPNFTGVVENVDALGTLKIAQGLYPSIKRVFVINDYTPTGRAWYQTMSHQLSKAGLPVTYSKSQSFKDLLNQIKHLPKHTLITIGVYFRDKNNLFIKNATRYIKEAAGNNPFFGNLDFWIKDYAGGSLVSGKKQGEIAGNIASEILNGTPPHQISVNYDSTDKVVNLAYLAQTHFDPKGINHQLRLVNIQDITLTQKETTYLKQKRTLNIALLENNPPYSFKNQQGKWTGLIPALLNSIAQKEKFTPNWVGFTSLTQLKQTLKTHHIDLIAGLFLPRGTQIQTLLGSASTPLLQVKLTQSQKQSNTAPTKKVYTPSLALIAPQNIISTPALTLKKMILGLHNYRLISPQGTVNYIANQDHLTHLKTTLLPQVLVSLSLIQPSQSIISDPLLLGIINKFIAQTIGSGQNKQLLKAWLAPLKPDKHKISFLTLFTLIASSIFIILLLASLWIWALRKQVKKQTLELTQALHQAELTKAEFMAIVENAPLGIVIVKLKEARYPIFINRQLEQILGYQPNEIIERKLSTANFYHSKEDLEKISQAYPQVLLKGETYSIEVQMVKKSGELFWAKIIGKIINLKNPSEGFIWVVQDIDLQYKAQQQLNHQAHFDFLLNIQNRQYFLANSTNEMDRAQRHHEPICFLMVDLDFFKKVNDQHGHEAGDLVLKETINRLKTHLRPYDILGRLGGEEFGITLPNTNLEEAKNLATRLCKLMHDNPIQTHLDNGTQIQINQTLSIGIVECQHQEDITQMAHLADAALYYAKETGRNQACYIKDTQASDKIYCAKHTDSD